METALRKANEQYEKRTHAQASGMDLKQLIIAVADHLKIDPIMINSSSRQSVVAQARSIICCVAVDRLKLSGAEVAHKLELSPSAVSKLASRGRKEKLTSEIADDILTYRSTKDP